jgi:hypothetical protein
MDLKSQRGAVEEFVRISGKQVTCDDVKKGLEETGVDLTLWEIPAGSSLLATIQNHLEALPSERVTRRVSPGGGTTFQWIGKSDPAPGSLASTTLKG